MDWYHQQINRRGFFEDHPAGVFVFDKTQHGIQKVMRSIEKAMSPPLRTGCVDGEINWGEGFTLNLGLNKVWVGIKRGIVPQELIEKFELERVNRSEVY